MYYYNDPFLPLIFIALGFALWAQWKVKSSYEKYQNIDAQAGLTAAEVARKILDSKGLKDIPVERMAGELTDNYDPRAKVLNLSAGVYDSASLAAYGIAAHEAGHAIQHANAFVPLKLRNNFFPVAALGSNLAIPLFFGGLLFSFPILMDLGIVLFALAVCFSIITLPVEFDASNKAILLLKENNFLQEAELPAARQILSAAALTYLAATLMALLQLLRLFFLRNSRDD
jgi:Zn-dependent membrane protease YugP